MTRFRWIMLSLYAALLLLFFLLGLSARAHDRDWNVFLLAIALLALTQAVFIFGAGTRDLLKPIHRKRRLLPPLIVAGLLFGFMTVTAVWACAEFTAWQPDFIFPDTAWFWAGLAAVWSAWSVLFYVRTRGLPKLALLERLAKWLLLGSLAETLGCIPAHILVSRRPGCLVGLQTAAGIAAGVLVMFWAFGPGILLLIYRERAGREAEAEAAGAPLPQGRTFSLLGLLLTVIFAGSVLGLFLLPEPGLAVSARPEFWIALGSGSLWLIRVLRHLRRWERGE
ncbi:MAG: hypothetical protein M5U26_27140 [Planctomycetota bacterium]|nr:hypothetical protein [Planctomycetota bacterium]